MSSPDLLDVDDHVRDISDDEIDHYDEHGWVALPSLISPDLAAEMLEHLKEIVGVPYDEMSADHPDAPDVMRRIQEAGRSVFRMSRLHDERIAEIVASQELGRASAKLSGLGPMRLLTDGVICKMPGWMEEFGSASEDTPGLFTGGTPWHQDFPAVPWDRVGPVQFWVALCEITPDMGSMQHLSGSHREPPLGCVQFTGGEQTLEGLYPELWERYELSPAHHFQPGDALAHHAMTMHYAEPNRTDKFRWVYTSYRIPANTLYTGLANSRIDQFDLEPWKPFDHPAFPIVSD